MSDLTKKDREVLAQQLIDANQMDVAFTPAHTQKMNLLLGTSFEGFVRRLNPSFPNDLRHLHRKTEDGWVAFSWKKRIYPVSLEQRLKKVMRDAVWPEMDAFLQSQDEPVCAHCGALEDLTVDHTPAFDAVAQAFMDEYGMPPVVKTECGVGRMFENIDDEAAWIAFHAARVTYAVLCRQCNSSKGTTDAVRRSVGAEAW